MYLESGVFSKDCSISNAAKKIMYFWIFRGGLGEARFSQTSSKGEKSINQLSKIGSTIG